MAKKAPFHIKSPVKNFHGRAKGGASHRAPLNTPLHITLLPLVNDNEKRVHRRKTAEKTRTTDISNYCTVSYTNHLRVLF